MVPGTPGTGPSWGTCDITGGASQGSPPELWCPNLLGGGSRRQAWLPMSVTLASSPCRGLLDTRDPEHPPPINPIISQTPWLGLEQVDEDAFISRTSPVSRGSPWELSQGLASLGHAGCGQPESAELTLYCTATVTHHVGSEPK